LLLHTFSLWKIASHRVKLFQYFKTDVDTTFTCLFLKAVDSLGQLVALSTSFVEMLAFNEY